MGRTMTVTIGEMIGQAEKDTRDAKKRDVCYIRVMFVMPNEVTAMKVRQVISEAIADIEGSSMDFRIANNVGAMMR